MRCEAAVTQRKLYSSHAVLGSSRAVRAAAAMRIGQQACRTRQQFFRVRQSGRRSCAPRTMVVRAWTRMHGCACDQHPPLYPHVLLAMNV
eukprot:359543-Chlamydomonas_euryale.AAC.5